MPRRSSALALVVSTTASLLVLSVAGTVAQATPAKPVADTATSNYSIALWGDMPYNALGVTQIPNLIADINKSDIAFSVFDGDIKAGSKSPCDPGQYQQAKNLFNSLSRPVVYTPGDNEWTDCDRASNGLLDPNAQLALIRSSFFADNKSQGQQKMTVVQQLKDFPENARWEHGGVTYITLNVPGTDNNAPQFDAKGNMLDPDGAITKDSAKQNGSLNEYTQRNAANLNWLDTGFNAARISGSKAIMIIQQGDMWSSEPTAHYAEEKKRLAQLAIDFKLPVVLVNGDTHEFMVSKPLHDGTPDAVTGNAAGNTIENFTRVTTFGSLDNHWVKANIDLADPNVFTFHQVVVPANLPAYTKP